VVLTVAALTQACAPSSPAAPVPTALLCQEASSPDHLSVHRTDAFPQNHGQFSFPADIGVADASRVQEAARALCSLPAMPSGGRVCPADLGIAYHLTFAMGGDPLAPVVVDAGGCETVQGAGPILRWAATSPAFWMSLGEAMGLPPATLSDLAGKFPR
jgi:hypothetical protein